LATASLITTIYEPGIGLAAVTRAAVELPILSARLGADASWHATTAKVATASIADLFMYSPWTGVAGKTTGGSVDPRSTAKKSLGLIYDDSAPGARGEDQ
jgi:hypothetical protein